MTFFRFVYVYVYLLEEKELFEVLFIVRYQLCELLNLKWRGCLIWFLYSLVFSAYFIL